MKTIERIYALLMQNNGLKVREIAKKLELDAYSISDILFSPDCIPYWYQNDSSLWFAKEGALSIDEPEQKDELLENGGFYKSINKEAFLENESDCCLEIYLDEISKYKEFKYKELLELFERYRNGDMAAYDLIVKSNLRFVTNLAKLYKFRGVPLIDLIQEGNIGLLKAIEKFDPSINNRFVEYAKAWILQSITAAVGNYGSIVRLPQNALHKYRQLQKHKELYEQKFGYPPALRDIELDIDKNLLYILYNFPSDLQEMPVSEDWETIEAKNEEAPDHNLMYESMLYEFHCLARVLDKKENDILISFYGIGGRKSETLEQIGKRYDLTRERVRQICEKAIKKIKVFYTSQKQRGKKHRVNRGTFDINNDNVDNGNITDKTFGDEASINGFRLFLIKNINSKYQLVNYFKSVMNLIKQGYFVKYNDLFAECHDATQHAIAMAKFLAIEEIHSLNKKSHNELSFALEYYLEYIYGERVEINSILNKYKKAISSEKKIKTKQYNKRIKVTFADGKVVINKSNTMTFVNVLEQCGLSKIKKLNISHMGFNLIIDRPIRKSRKRLHFLKPCWYIFTEITTDQMVYDLQYISKKLNLNLKVQLVSYIYRQLDETECAELKTNNHEPFGETVITDKQDTTLGQEIVNEPDFTVNQESVGEPDTAAEQDTTLGQEIVNEPDITVNQESVGEPDTAAEQDTTPEQEIVNEPDIADNQDSVVEPNTAAEQDTTPEREIVNKPDITDNQESVVEKYVIDKQEKTAEHYNVDKQVDATNHDSYNKQNSSGNMISQYCKYFENIRTAPGAPHKPIMLMVVLEMIVNKEIKENKIYYNNELVKKFTKKWDRYIKGKTKFKCTPYNPFFYLDYEPFWIFKSSKHIASPTHLSLIKNKAYAIIDDGLLEVCTRGFAVIKLKRILESKITL